MESILKSNRGEYMSRKQRIFELIDRNVASPIARNMIKDYISNLLKNNTTLEKSISESKKKSREKKHKQKY